MVKQILIIKYSIRALVWLLDKMFDNMDSNDDGRISEEEALAYTAKMEEYLARLF